MVNTQSNNQSSNASADVFEHARGLLGELLQSDPIVSELGLQEECNNAQVYDNAATIFALVLQRLGGSLTLKQVVVQLQQQFPDLLHQKNKRVRTKSLSQNPSAFDKARRAIPLQNVRRFCSLMCDHWAKDTPKVFEGKRVFVIDGTTITLPPTPELTDQFPPARNQLGNSVWPVMSLLVAHELETSCALIPEIGAMHGNKNTSEAKLFKDLIKRVPPDSIVMGDSGFGIYSVAHHCRLAGRQFVLRLTKQRYRSHRKRGTLVEEGNGYRTDRLLWKPSAKELRNHPEIPRNASMEVFLHQITLPDGRTLELISDVNATALSLSQLYHLRYDAEFDIRDFKVTMDSENIRARSRDTVLKELYGSVIAYNLVIQFRRQAAHLISLKPRRLSFSDVWLDFRFHLLAKQIDTPEAWQAQYELALQKASERVLPDRRGRRSSPRVAHTRRQKATKFERKNPVEAAKARREKKDRIRQPRPK